MTALPIQTIMHKNPQPWTVSAILNQGYGQTLLFDEQRACLNVTDFYFLEGPFLKSFQQALIQHIRLPAIITSSNPDWYSDWAFEKEVCMERVLRRMYSWTGKLDRLATYLAVRLEPTYSVKPIGETEAAQIRDLEWAEGVFDSYAGMTEFLERGFGYCMTAQDKIISLCMSFSHSAYGIEIEVDTDPAYQGRGFGKIVSAHFVSESLKRCIKPLWDATTPPSAKIAESIGFDFMREYESLWIYQK